jgi:hypothetical protein
MNFVKASHFDMDYKASDYEVLQKELLDWRERNNEGRNRNINVITEREGEEEEDDRPLQFAE